MRETIRTYCEYWPMFVDLDSDGIKDYMGLAPLCRGQNSLSQRARIQSVLQPLKQAKQYTDSPVLTLTATVTWMLSTAAPTQ